MSYRLLTMGDGEDTACIGAETMISRASSAEAANLRMPIKSTNYIRYKHRNTYTLLYILGSNNIKT